MKELFHSGGYPVELPGPSEDELRTEKLFGAMTPINGEVRVVYRCGDCGHLFGRRYIPYGLGQGLSVGLCGCQLTSRNRPMIQVERRDP